jgi:hypothetical protein
MEAPIPIPPMKRRTVNSAMEVLIAQPTAPIP